MKSKRAAVYVRVSTERQQYSTAHQLDTIETYAHRHGLTIVKTYTDNGRSGLTLKGRLGLRQLLMEVLSAPAEFDHVLVYDVSRWGRFQDADEAAYYEHMIRRTGTQLHYCAEQFSNDGSSYASVLKAVKRTMAAEYSRELSAKTFAGSSRLALMGYRQGGAPGYGLRRLLIDRGGHRKGLLKAGEYKTLQSDRIVLVPGPKHEVATVLKIFNLYVRGRKSLQGIADLLAQSDPKSEWTRCRVRQILTNAKYMGSNIWNRKSTRLGQKAKRVPREEWLCKEGAFTPIVSRNLFEQAQAIVKARSEMTSNDQILEHLRRILKQEGRLTMRILNKDPAGPSALTVFRRFGSFTAACKLISYQPESSYRFSSGVHHARVRPYGSKRLVREIEDAVKSARLREIFTISELREACPGWARLSYNAFVAGSPELERTARGTYRLK